MRGLKQLDSEIYRANKKIYLSEHFNSYCLGLKRAKQIVFYENKNPFWSEPQNALIIGFAIGILLGASIVSIL